MSRWYTIRQFFRHRWDARSWDAFHSPYLFRLFTFCCKNDKKEQGFEAIERIRRRLKNNSSVIPRRDYGAGSHIGSNLSTQRISRIARHALSLPFQCRFMARLARFSEAHTILELGTSMGIMTAYLKTGSPESIITTVEGDPEIASLALKTFSEMELRDMRTVNSTFEDFLSLSKENPCRYDLVFFDGNHRSSALLKYYESLKSCFSDHTILVVDDIYWSPDMQQGWQALISRPEITQSVDCFYFGMLFFNPDFLQKEHHRINLPLRV